MNIQHVEARDLGDAWFQCLYRLIEHGTVFKIDRGSYAGQKRLEFDWITIHIKNPGVRPLLPQIEPHYNIPNPVAEDYLDDYVPYLMTGELKPGESYTYGQRITKYPIEYPLELYKTTEWKDILVDEIDSFKKKKIIIEENKKFYLNQMELIIWTYKNKGFRNNQMIIQIGHPTDSLLKDPPCLRTIDTRIQDNKLNFAIYFRSWDLFNGFPANLAAIQMMKEYMASEIGIEDGEMICTSKGLHVYDYAFDLIKCLRMRDDMELKNGSM